MRAVPLTNVGELCGNQLRRAGETWMVIASRGGHSRAQDPISFPASSLAFTKVRSRRALSRSLRTVRRGQCWVGLNAGH